MSTTASFEILTPVIDISDDDDDDDLKETDDYCRYSVSRGAGLFFVRMFSKKMIWVISYFEKACFRKKSACVFFFEISV
jgi:hypothetical protein